MRIKNDFRPMGTDFKAVDTSSAPNVQGRSFQDTMQQQQTSRSADELQGQMQQIHLQGDRVVKSMTVRELHRYKQLLKQFLEETVRKGIGLKDTKGWDRRGRGKRYKILDEIDETLVQMGDELLQTEQGRVELLNKIGEIRGLLINLIF